MKKRIFDLISAEYEKMILIFDEDKIIDKIDYAEYLKDSEFNIALYWICYIKGIPYWHPQRSPF
ncbi:MAG: hypothetical protein Q8O06_11250 [Acetobacterium sp.]|nr:hypothetical protein [Acetobacterium sp.]